MSEADNKYHANQLMRACYKSNLIDEETGHPDTNKIDRNIVNKLACISISKQRRLVNLLFYWEEELTRWRLLSEEEDEIALTLESDTELTENDRIHLREALKITQARKRVLPSLREASGNVQFQSAEPPRYEA